MIQFKGVCLSITDEKFHNRTQRTVRFQGEPGTPDEGKTFSNNTPIASIGIQMDEGTEDYDLYKPGARYDITIAPVE